MPDTVSDSGDSGSGGVAYGPDGSITLVGTATDYGAAADSSTTWGGDPYFQTGATFVDDPQMDSPTLSGTVNFQGNSNGSVLQGGVTQQSPPVLQSQVTKQAVKVDIHTTVVQPLEPCRSLPYLKLVFLPVDTTVRFQRDLRREVNIPAPQPQFMTVTDYKAKFATRVHTGDPRYMLRWKQILPVVSTPQDSGTLNYKSVDVYDLRTAINLSDSSVLDWLDISELPLTQVTQAVDIEGGTTDEEFVSYELYLDSVFFVDVDQSTGQLIGKDPVETGLFTGV